VSPPAVYLRIADLTIRAAATDPRIQLERTGAAAAFLCAPRPPDVSIDVTLRPPPDDGACDVLFDSGAVWKLFRHDRGLFFRFFSSTFGRRPYRTARFDDSFTTGEVHVDPAALVGDAPLDPLEYPLDELILLHLLARHGGLELHACGVADTDGAGYLFAGHSGAGKTTMARLWASRPGVIVLSDDRIVVREEAGELWMYGTPWHGDEPLASPGRTRVTGAFLIAHGPSPAVAALPAAAAAARLFAASFPLFYDPAALGASLDGLAALVGRIPCQHLEFAPDLSVVDFVRQHRP
jgi:hypothetical protein